MKSINIAFYNKNKKFKVIINRYINDIYLYFN